MAGLFSRIFKKVRRFMTRQFILCVVVRILSVFYVQTSFVPDEYWQSLEVAHKLAFGYGHLTWEWRLGIRSYVPPVLIAFLYKILECLKCDSVNVVILAPRFAQALFSAISDNFFVLWHKKTTGCNGNWAWFTVMTSWFWFYCASRTLSNTVETCLNMIGLYHYPWEEVVLYDRPTRFSRTHQPDQKKYGYLWVVAISCVLRPTAGIFWLPLVVLHVALSNRKAKLIFSKCIPIAATVVSFFYEFDSYFHGTPVITWINFFSVNVMKNIGEFYGTESFFWYFVIGLPSALGILFLPFGISMIKVCNYGLGFHMEAILTFTGIWTITILSLMAHKEIRFLLPILPLCFHVTASWLSIWSRKTKKPHRYALATFIAVGSFVSSTYFGQYHQRGTLEVMNYLSKESRLYPDTSLLFLMPCHSTPLYSHLHVNVTARFLTCEPDVFDARPYVDEADMFFANPQGWLVKTFPANGPMKLPTHIIMFDRLRQEVVDFLTDHGYLKVIGFYHTWFPSGRVGNYVLVFEQMELLGSCERPADCFKEDLRLFYDDDY